MTSVGQKARKGKTMIASRRKKKLKKHPNTAKQYHYISLDSIVTVILASLLLLTIIQSDTTTSLHEDDEGKSQLVTLSPAFAIRISTRRQSVVQASCTNDNHVTPSHVVLFV